MGYGNYSHDAHAALLRGRVAKSTEDVFQQRACHPLMSPKGVRTRESRDGADHPESLGIVFALDVTGSMAEIPSQLASKTLPTFMKVLGDCRVKDPQILFCAVGDATSDRAPLQVGQFESTAELMDQWLTWSYLERGGGGTGQESYELALYFLALHTEMDCMVKRRKRGYLFMTGDEQPYPILSRHIVESVVGDRLDEDLKVEEIVAELQKTFVPFFLVPEPGRRSKCEPRWRELLGDHVLCLDRPEDVCYAAGGAVALLEGLVPDLGELAKVLRDAGAPRQQIDGAIRALAPIVDGRAGKTPPTSARAPSALRRLFGG
jgi:hypothetical protein